VCSAFGVGTCGVSAMFELVSCGLWFASVLKEGVCLSRRELFAFVCLFVGVCVCVSVGMCCHCVCVLESDVFGCWWNQMDRESVSSSG
jgi:hypothetical protein